MTYVFYTISASMFIFAALAMYGDKEGSVNRSEVFLNIALSFIASGIFAIAGVLA